MSGKYLSLADIARFGESILFPSRFTPVVPAITGIAPPPYTGAAPLVRESKDLEPKYEVALTQPRDAGVAPPVGAGVNYLIEQAIAKGKDPNISEICIYDTVRAHDQVGGNYEWLWPTYGRLLWVDFQEPADTGSWRPYDRYWWSRHAALVSHDPTKLVEEHVKWYIDPKTKTINLRFWFETPLGVVYSMAPTQHFYELERDYFAHNHLCSAVKEPAHQDDQPPALS